MPNISFPITAGYTNTNHAAGGEPWDEVISGQRFLGGIPSQIEVPVRHAGTFQNLSVVASLQQHDGRVTLMVNRIATSVLVNVGSGSGLYENTSDTAVVTATDEVFYQMTIPGPDVLGTNRYSGINIQFTPTDADLTVSFLIAASDAFEATFQNTGVEYVGVAGVIDEQGTTEGTAVQVPVGDPFTWRGMWVVVKTNTRTASSHGVSRINGNTGNQVITHGSMTTGQFEDTSNSDAIVAGDLINFRQENDSGSGAMEWSQVVSFFESPDSKFFKGAIFPTGSSFNDGLTRFHTWGAGFDGNATESRTAVSWRENLTLEVMSAYVSSNTLGDPNVAFVMTRINGADGNLVLSWDDGVTGVKTTAEGIEDSITAGDIVQGKVTSSTTSGAWRIRWAVFGEKGIDPPDPEGSYEPSAIVTGESIGLHWLELYHKDSAGADKTYLWAAVDLNDDLAYYGGYKEPRVLNFGPFERALSDHRGQYEAATFSWRVADTDRLIRGTFLNSDNLEHRTLTNRLVALRTIDDKDRRLEGRPRLVARGLVRDMELIAPFQARFTATDLLSARFDNSGQTRNVPERLVAIADFPDCPAENLSAPVPIVYGNYANNEGGAAAIVAGPSSVTVIGLASPLAAPTGLAVSLVSSPAQEGVKNRPRAYSPIYHVTWFNAAGEESQLSATVGLTTLQNGSDQTPHITWNAVTGAVKYHLYRAISYKSDFNQLSMIHKTVTNHDDVWVGRNERSAGYDVPHNHLHFYSSWRAGCRFRVYAKFADGSFSLPTEAYMVNTDATISKGSAFFSGVHQHNDSAGTIGASGNRRARVTWTAVSGALEYHLFRGHGAYKWGEPFRQVYVVPASTLTVDLTFVANRNANPAAPTLPDEVSETSEASGKVPCLWVGSETISGDDWNVLLVCGHAVKQITGVFYEVDASEDDEEDADLEETRQFRQVDNYGTGGTNEWLAPGQAGWPHANDYIEINGNRYVVIYTKLDPPPKTVTVDLLGIEDVGDTTGLVLTSISDQCQHFLTNYLLPDSGYKTGNWGTIPNWPNDLDGDGLPQLDAASFAKVKAVAERRIAGGYNGSASFGVEGDFTNVRDALARFAISGGFQLGWSRNNQVLADMFDDDVTELATTPIYSGSGDDNLVKKNSVRVQMDDSLLENEVLYNFGRSHVKQEWETLEASVSDVPSITAHQQVVTSKPLDLWFVRSAAIALNLAQHRLLDHKEVPRRIRFSGSLDGLNRELGDTIRLTSDELPLNVLAPLRIIRHRARMSDNEVDYECQDLTRLLSAVGHLCDEATATDSYATATAAERAQCFYLCSEVTGQFANGDPGKRLR